MRISTVVSSARGLVPVGHLGWTYRSRADFRARAAEYASDGLRAGQWVQIVTDARDDADLIADAIGAGPPELGICAPSALLPTCGDRIEPRAAVHRLATVTSEVLAAGYTGYRAVVDATSLADVPGRLAAYARFEFLVDARMCDLPLTALCAFDETELGRDAAAGLCCLHLHTPATYSPPFRLFAQPPHTFALAGDIDLLSHDLLRSTLQAISDCISELPAIDVDVRQLGFVDHRGLQILDEWATRTGTRIRLQGANALISTIADILQLPALELHEPG